MGDLSEFSAPVRMFLRASGLPYEETDVWGHTRSPEFLAKCPAHMTPLLRDLQAWAKRG